jgi:hypothetical protein
MKETITTICKKIGTYKSILQYEKNNGKKLNDIERDIFNQAYLLGKLDNKSLDIKILINE